MNRSDLNSDADRVSKLQAAPDSVRISRLPEQYRAGSGSCPATISVNRADSAQLQFIAGMDETRAQRLIEYRSTRGPVRTWDELKQLEGFDDELVATLRRQASL